VSIPEYSAVFRSNRFVRHERDGKPRCGMSLVWLPHLTPPSFPHEVSGASDKFVDPFERIMRQEPKHLNISRCSTS
jgi:hypothetical protein